VAQPERDLIFAAPGRDLVEKRFDREYIALPSQCAQRGCANGHRRQAMAFDTPCWKIIKRDRIAVRAAAIGLWWIARNHARKRICQFVAGEQSRLRRASRAGGVAIAPDRVAPVDDIPLCIEAGFDLDRHRRTEGRLGHLVFARPQHPHRPSIRGLCQQYSVKCAVICGIVAVAAGAFHMFDGDVLDRQLENQRQIGAQEIDALTMGPDVDAVSVPLRHRA